MNGKTKNWLMTGVSTAFVISLAIGYGQVKGGVKHIEGDIKEVKVDVAKNTEDIDQEENTNITQSLLIEQMQQNQLKFIEEFKELQKAK